MDLEQLADEIKQALFLPAYEREYILKQLKRAYAEGQLEGFKEAEKTRWEGFCSKPIEMSSRLEQLYGLVETEEQPMLP